MADQSWTPVEQTATGPDGSKMALVGGNWQPAQQTATGPDGKKVAMLAQSPGQKTIADLKPDLKLDAEGKPTPSPTVKSALEAIGTSSAFGGALGAVSPELLTGAGYALSFIPEVGPVIGTALMEAGTAARGARLATAASGMLSGATSEAAGQGVEAAGGSKGTADAARLVGGMVGGPVVGALASKAKGLFGAVAEKLELMAAADANVGKAAAALRGIEDAGVPANALHQTLQQGADAHIQDAQKAGEKVMADARQRAADVGSQDAKAAQKVLDDGKARADQIVAEAKKRAADLNKASGNRMATAGKVLAQAEPSLRVVGQPREISDIGKELQTAVSQEHQAAIDARTKAYNNLKDQRDSIVKSKEQAGQTVEQTEGMKDLKSYIKGKVDSNASPRQTTDQGTLRVYGQVNEALQNPSFEALDQVRRKLGDVLGGRDVEGYSAVGKDVAGKLYAKISDIQKEFVGEDAAGTNLQQMMQEQYHDASLGLRKFGTGAGGKAAAIDRVDPERFAADPSGVPKQFFSSQQSVRDLKELTGDSGLVQRAGSSYVSSQLRGMSAKQVGEFAKKNSDWIREVPGLSKSVADYATRLGKIEATAAKAGASGEALAKRGAAILPEAEGAAAKERAETISRAGKIGEGSVDTQSRVLQEGGKAAEQATKAAAAPAEKLKGILNNDEPPGAIRDLLLNGKPEQTRLAARILQQTPEGRKQLEGSVRQITSGLKEEGLQNAWDYRLKPMLTNGKMLAPDRMKALTKDVEGLLKAYSGKPPVTMVQRLINGAIASAGGNYVGQDGREGN